MSTVLMDILKDTDKNTIDAYILKKRDDMKITNFIDIAKNSAVKHMSKYTFNNQAIGQFAK